MTALDFVSEIDDSLNFSLFSTPLPEECGPKLGKYSLKILHANIRSMWKNFDNFLVAFSRMKIGFDVIILSECWLTDISIIKQIDGYISYNSQKFINKAGGVIMYVSNRWSPNVSEPYIEEGNGLLMEVPGLFSVIGIYRSPSFKDPNSFICSLGSLLKSMTKTPCLILAGDANIDILTVSEDVTNYLVVLAEHGLVSAINSVTHDKTCLDHIFVSSSNTEATAGICTVDVTDHYMVMLGCNLVDKSLRPLKRSKFSVDFNGLKDELVRVDWSETLDCDSSNDAASQFSHTLGELISRHSKSVRISHSKYTIKPWMTPGLIRCQKHKDRLHLELRKNLNDDKKRLVYSRYRNFYISLLRRLKTKFESKVLSSNQNNPKKLWKAINKFSNRRQNVNSNAELLTTTRDSVKESLDDCNAYFSSVGENLANSILSHTLESQESLAGKTSLSHSPVNSLFFSPTDRREVLHLIGQLDPDRSPGLDKINNRLLKVIGHLIAEPLAAIFNQSMESGVFPGVWKRAAVIPIFKQGEKQNPGNYRPISLLSSISKLLERIINKRLVDFLESNGLLSDSQYGFRSGRSTEDAVTLLTDIVSSHLDRGRNCVGVFLDLAKAFDTVSSPILLKKLELSGIRGKALDWFRSYLSDRAQCVKIGESMSDFMPITFGVPQGSILGPTLFLVYINDVMSISSPNTDIICYADDTVLIFHDTSWEKVRERAVFGMSSISKWLTNNLLTLNAAKTTFLCFHKTAASSPANLHELAVHDANCSLHNPRVQSCACASVGRAGKVRYLGIYIDEKLNFKDHIVATATRVRKLLHVFKNLRDTADKKLLMQIYTSLCESIINYCILAWGGAASSHLIALERAQRGVLKIALGKHFRFPTISLFEETKVLSVRRLFILRAVILTHRSMLRSGLSSKLLHNRVYKAPTPLVHTRFAHRFGAFLFPSLHNRLLGFCDFKRGTLREAKLKIKNTLMCWSYDDTEAFIRIGE